MNKRRWRISTLKFLQEPTLSPLGQ
uniref:Uncharacterized protein n=1 Tax=Anguilla anguilla TaxID=7936 RepID=A0A0E9V384_ANGAN